MKFSVYIVCLSVFSLSNLKLHKTLAVENIFIQEKSMLRLTFNPGLALTGFRTTRPGKVVLILRRKKDGDWYIYPKFLAHENFNNVHKKVQKGYKIFKPTIHNVLSTGTNIVKIWLSLCLKRCVRFLQ